MAANNGSVSAIEFDSVNFSYDGPIVLQNATLSIAEGDFVSVVGPNGGGKSTLLKLMLGLLRPQQGTIRVFGQSPKVSRSQIGYTPQFMTVDFSFPLSVFDVVLMGRLQAGWRFSSLWYSSEDRKSAEKAIETMQLSEYADVPFAKLSGGQRQRVLIARAICGHPKILLLDEPTNNIDVKSEQMLSQILNDLNRFMTIVMVSHDIGFVSQCVKNVLCVNRTVAVHATSELNAGTIQHLYGRSGMKIVLHDHH